MNPKFNWVHYRIQDDRGLLEFRRGTGDNVEITIFKASERGKGYGKSLLVDMLTRLESCPPYHAVYGFTRVGNFDAQQAYRALGFTLSEVRGVYKDGHAVVFSAPYEELCAKHLKDPDA